MRKLCGLLFLLWALCVAVGAEGVEDIQTWETNECTLLESFRMGERVYSRIYDYTVVLNEERAVRTYYRQAFPIYTTDTGELADFALKTLAEAEAAFEITLQPSVLRLTDGREIPVPSSEICTGYDVPGRYLLTMECPDGGYQLLIITADETLDVLRVNLPWPAGFDSFHIGTMKDHFILLPRWDEPYEASELVFAEEEGRWFLTCINNGCEVIGIGDTSVMRDVDDWPVTGLHPWHDLTEMDLSALPHSYEEMTATLQSEGWAFLTAGTSLYAAPDAEMPCATIEHADTPIHVLRREGEWSLVVPNCEENAVYVSTSALLTLPETVLPGGEWDGVFATLTVEDGIANFQPLPKSASAEEVTFAPFPVLEGFEEAVLRAYQTEGGAITPMSISAQVAPTLGVGEDAGANQLPVRGVWITNTTAFFLLKNPKGGDIVRIIHRRDDAWRVQSLRMPAPCHVMDVQPQECGGWLWLGLTAENSHIPEEVILSCDEDGVARIINVEYSDFELYLDEDGLIVMEGLFGITED